MERTVLWAAIVAVALGAEFFDCPVDETTGKFPDPDRCDQYWDCFRGEAKKIECADGLAFNPERVRTQKEPCDYVFSVDCTGREGLGEPQSTENCYRANGLFEHPSDCGRYYSCKAGLATLQLCPPGLHYSLKTLTCDWPVVADRGSCEILRSIGTGNNTFTCDPKEKYYTPQNQEITNPTFPHYEDCRKFFVCKNGVDPAIASCDYGLVYNIDLALCDAATNVPECATYYEVLEAEAAAAAELAGPITRKIQ